MGHISCSNLDHVPSKTFQIFPLNSPTRSQPYTTVQLQVTMVNWTAPSTCGQLYHLLKMIETHTMTVTTQSGCMSFAST